MLLGMNISINNSRDTVTAKLDRNETARWERGGKDSDELSKHVHSSIREWAEDRDYLGDERVSAEIESDDGVILSIINDVSESH